MVKEVGSGGGIVASVDEDDDVVEETESDDEEEVEEIIVDEIGRKPASQLEREKQQRRKATEQRAKDRREKNKAKYLQERWDAIVDIVQSQFDPHMDAFGNSWAHSRRWGDEEEDCIQVRSLYLADALVSRQND